MEATFSYLCKLSHLGIVIARDHHCRCRHDVQGVEPRFFFSLVHDRIRRRPGEHVAWPFALRRNNTGVSNTLKNEKRFLPMQPKYQLKMSLKSSPFFSSLRQAGSSLSHQPALAPSYRLSLHYTAHKDRVYASLYEDVFNPERRGTSATSCAWEQQATHARCPMQDWK